MESWCWRILKCVRRLNFDTQPQHAQCHLNHSGSHPRDENLRSIPILVLNNSAAITYWRVDQPLQVAPGVRVWSSRPWCC